MKTYTKGGHDDNLILLTVIREHHPALEISEVSVSLLFEATYDKDERLMRGLKHYGYSAAAVIKITSLRDRALEITDAVITIDQATWDELSREEREALLDHELTHLEVVSQGGGRVQVADGALASKPAELDDLKRPKLKMRKHDFHVGGFMDVIERRGNAALEVQALRTLQGPDGQYFWDFADLTKASN